MTEKRLTIICGAYGSGKTEFAMEYALEKSAAVSKAALIDLDVVNPFFRSRDLTEQFAKKGLEVISSNPGLENSDMPSLSPKIYGVLQDPTYEKLIFDVGGDPAGSRILGRFHQFFPEGSYDFWMVINPYRPDTRNAEQIVQMFQALQAAGHLQINGLIGNINLGTETDLQVWHDGQAILQEAADKLQLPVVYQVLNQEFYLTNRSSFSESNVFTIKPKMRPPWEVEE